MIENIEIRGARQHNLKNFDLTIPRNKFIVITGLSGSGKSTLAFDTIYAEGQRRYVESLSAYARQFLGNLNKPDVDSIDGLSPAISIEQKTTSKNPRSTVGTVTEIYDYLRLLFARVGTSFCPKCNSRIKPQSPENIVNLILTGVGKKIGILAPIINGVKGTYDKLFENIRRDGFTKIRIDGITYSLDSISELKLDRYKRHWIEIVVDRVKISKESSQRISDSVSQALEFGKGSLIVVDLEGENLLLDKIGKSLLEEKELKLIQRDSQTLYSTFGSCQKHSEVVFLELEPRQFSFNSPFGACESCLGLGVNFDMSEELIIPDKSKSIINGAIAVYGKLDLTWRSKQISNVGKLFGFDICMPLCDFSEEQLKILLYGSNIPIKTKWHSGATMKQLEKGWEGVIPQTMRLYKTTDSEGRKHSLEKFMVQSLCKKCLGKRLKATMLFVKIGGKSIIDVTEMSIFEAQKFFENLKGVLSEKEFFIAKQVLKEILDRLSFLNNVGLGYLNLSRSAGTLSGGEAQRIRLATQIGSNLMGVLYVLDEPSIGLHQRDNEKLIQTLHRLRDIGNTLIVVEHDEDTIRSADFVIDIGPGAGINGGYIVATGTPKELGECKNSLTGAYLSGVNHIPVPKVRRRVEMG